LSNPWAVEIWRISGFSLAAVIIGLLTGHLFLVLFVTAAGYLAWLLVNVARIERWVRADSDAQPILAAGVLDELSHQVYRLRDRSSRRERRLTDALNKFQQSAAAMPDATVVLRANGDIEWFNEAAKRLLGLRPRQDLGRRIDNLIRHPEFVRFFARGEYSEILEFPSPEDESITLSLQVVPYGDDQRLMIARDVTYLHRLEQVRRDFVANVSHELRTPLTVISGYLETMSGAEDECTRQWNRSLTFMTQHTQRMQRLVEDLLLLSRLETETGGDKQEPIAVPAMLNIIREEAVALGAGKGHKVTLQSDPHLWLRGNEKELRSAFSNLVANAVQYTPESGAITIRWYADDRGAHFQVADTGIGIPARHIPRLTERFYRVDTGRSRQDGGTGLGLAIVKHVLQRHGAELQVDSTVGKGSTFTCNFPLPMIIHETDNKTDTGSQVSGLRSKVWEKPLKNSD
jgi:two-component system phosphate regulon sensor histidine kinase PhoR